MKHFLFLYPTHDYFNHVPGAESRRYQEVMPQFLGMINARYRQQGYQINWLLFCKEDRTKIDLRLMSSYIKRKAIAPGDNILNAGITSNEMMLSVYADPLFVLEQLEYPQRIVIGGFHFSDCIEKVAKASYDEGIDTFVDEDVTNLGLSALLLGRYIPAVREKWTLREMGRIRDETDIQLQKHGRKNRPWLVQEIG